MLQRRIIIKNVAVLISSLERLTWSSDRWTPPRVCLCSRNEGYRTPSGGFASSTVCQQLGDSGADSPERQALRSASASAVSDKGGFNRLVPKRDRTQNSGISFFSFFLQFPVRYWLISASVSHLLRYRFRCTQFLTH